MLDLFDTARPCQVPLELRAYQREAVDAVFDAWNCNVHNPLVEMATGTGKALVIAALVLEVLARWAETRVLVLTGSVEILVQDLEHLARQAPDVAAAAGVNSASLGRRESTRQVVLAQVQSVYRDPSELGTRQLVIVDEAHRIPRHAHSMYHKIFAAVQAGEICGFTATAFRLDSGLLTEGRNALFSKVVFKFGYRQALLGGHVVPIVSKPGTNAIDTSNVRIRRGEFDEAALERAATSGDLVERTCAEIVRRCEGRWTVLLFCVGVAHAEAVATALRGLGETAAVVTGRTGTAERQRLVEDFKDGDIRFLVNVGVLTTGSNIPPVDAIAVLRPTMSTGLWIQIVGRGTRNSPGKADCAVFDFGGNIRRHGPIDIASVNFDASMLKECPECEAVAPSNDTICKACGYEWPKKEIGPQGPRKLRHGSVPDEAPAQVTRWTPEWVAVTRLDARMHHKLSDPDAPPTLRVDYLCGLFPYSEWVCFEHDGYARSKAAQWWTAMGGLDPVPDTVAEALERFGELGDVAEIMPIPDRKNGKYWRIEGRRLADGAVITPALRRASPAPTDDVPIDDEIAF